MKNLKSKILIIIASFVTIVAIAVGVYAYVSRISTRGEIVVSAATVTAETTYTASNDSFNWTYTSAGDTKQINITTSNQTGVVLHRFYNIQLASGFTSNENLLKAVLVYYNDTFIGSLNDVVTTNPKIEEEYNFIGLSSNKTDNFKFELHEAARNSIFDNKDMKITISTYTENSDYYKYIFVNNEADFKKAIDDVNSGLFTEVPSIVLCGNLTLSNSYTISEPVIIHLNGSTLNGSLTLNDTTTTNPNALLEVLGNGTFNVTVTLGANYDTTGAVTLVKNHIKEVLKNGISAGSTTNILGYYSFYGISVAAQTRCTFTSPNVIVANSSNEYYNAIGSIRVNSDENINFKILGTKTQLIDATLAHMPQNGDTISLDLYLPTYIPSENANITWTSSDESIITSTGRITAERLENAQVTLYAEIKVNNTVITRKYSFKVTAHNNEINFYKLVQEISPIVINTVRNSAADDPNALYHLPIVNENNGVLGTYDYRTSFVCPTDNVLFNWVAYQNIGLENITYSMTQTQQTNYDYITLTNSNELYLNNITLNNYATITITGDFGNSEVYSTDINISITVGSNTQLLEKAFTQVSEEISQISILGNILQTRISSGMHNEKGDFSLSHSFIDSDTNQVNEDYTIEYSGEADIISSITYNSTTNKYDFAINPEYFNEYETTVAFTATVYYRKGQTGETSKSRTFYVTVPAALHQNDFGTISIYNSTKYQVFNQLPSNEKTGTTGYSLSGSILTDTNLDYILLRDIVGDANYLTNYCNNDNTYLTKINYVTQNYCVGTETLSYQTSSSNPTSITDTQAYDFARLIEWATGNTRATASSVVSNTTALQSYASKKANAEDYLNKDEIAVLKQYYQYCTGATNAQWESLFSEVFNVAPGYIYTNPALLNTVISCISNQITGNKYYSKDNQYTSFSTIFGKYMEILQRYAVSTTQVNTNDVAPCQEQYNTRFVWTHTSTNDTQISVTNNAIDLNGTSLTANFSVQLKDGTWWQRFVYSNTAGGDGAQAGVYARPAFAADRTSYITEAELTVLRIFLLNSVTKSGTTTTTYIADSFNSTNLDAIEETINANPDYYSGYLREHFDHIAEAILNAFVACLEIPTYFSTDGVAKIIQSFYDKKNYDLPTYDGTTNTTPFTSSVSSGIPYITNADNIKSVLSYFVKLKTLTFNGNSNLAAFLSENGLSTVFARTGLYNTQIQNLTMNHVAHTSINFDLTNIKYFTNLKVLDLSNNSGIQSVNELVNVNRGNYTSVNIENIGIAYEYQEFAIDNIATPDCTVRYTNSSGTNTYSNNNSRASELADLSDFNKFITKYMYMTNVVYDKDGNATQVAWRIDEGNEINSDRITAGGNYPSISTIEEMNSFISPYYYCTQSFTYRAGSQNLSFTNKHLYRVYYENGVFKSEDKGEYDSISDLPNLDVSTYGEINEPDVSSYVPVINSTSQKDIINAGTVNYSDRTDWFTNGTLTGFQKTGTLDYLIHYNDPDVSSNRKYSLTLPTDSDIIDFISESVEDETGSIPYSISYTVVISVKSKNFNGYTNNQGQTLPNAWQQGLFINSTISGNSEFQDNPVYYTDDLVYGQEIIDWGTFDDSYLGQTIAIGYYHMNNNDKTNANKFYGGSNANSKWKAQAKQSFYRVNISISYTCYYDSDLENIRINYTNGTFETITNVYAAGWRIKQSVGTTVEYTESESNASYTMPIVGSSKYIYYDGANTTITDSSGNVVPCKNGTLLYVIPQYVYLENSRSRTYRIVGTLYTWEFWYIDYSGNYDNFVSQWQSYYPENNGQVRDGGNISSVSLNDGAIIYYSSDLQTIVDSMYTSNVTRTNISGFDVNWETVPLTSTWAVRFKFNNYLSYVEKTNSSTVSKLNNQVLYYKTLTDSITVIFNYTGATGSELVYKESLTGTSKSYNNNYGYRLTISNNQLSWNQYSTSITNPTGTTMDSLITTANQHFNDYHYGEYYGKYYGYNGNNFYSELGYYYEKGYVYRIMPNESNTAFTWVKICQYTSDTADNILKSLGTGGLSVGAYCYATSGAGFGFFDGSQWYKVVLDEKTNIVNLVKFNDVGFTTDGAQTYTQLTNDKLVPKSIGDGQDYLGYSGTFTIQISALIRTYDSTTGTYTEYIKTYKLKFVGSLTS